MSRSPTPAKSDPGRDERDHPWARGDDTPDSVSKPDGGADAAARGGAQAGGGADAGATTDDPGRGGD